MPEGNTNVNFHPFFFFNHYLITGHVVDGTASNLLGFDIRIESP